MAPASRLLSAAGMVVLLEMRSHHVASNSACGLSVDYPSRLGCGLGSGLLLASPGCLSGDSGLGAERPELHGELGGSASACDNGHSLVLLALVLEHVLLELGVADLDDPVQLYIGDALGLRPLAVILLLFIELDRLLLGGRGALGRLHVEVVVVVDVMVRHREWRGRRGRWHGLLVAGGVGLLLPVLQPPRPWEARGVLLHDVEVLWVRQRLRDELLEMEEVLAFFPPHQHHQVRGGGSPSSSTCPAALREPAALDLSAQFAPRLGAFGGY